MYKAFNIVFILQHQGKFYTCTSLGMYFRIKLVLKDSSVEVWLKGHSTYDAWIEDSSCPSYIFNSRTMFHILKILENDFQNKLIKFQKGLGPSTCLVVRKDELIRMFSFWDLDNKICLTSNWKD